MRNVAVNGSSTDFLFLVDLDFMPLEDAERILDKYKLTMQAQQVFNQ